MTGDVDSYAVLVFQAEGVWQAELLPERLTEDLDGLIAAVRQQPSERGAIALVNAGNDFFVAARAVNAQIRLVLSDVTASVAWDLARQACRYLGAEIPGEDDLEEVWPVGDLGLFDDLGMEEMEMGALLSDVDAYADEQLLALARRLGFGSVFERTVDPVAL